LPGPAKEKEMATSTNTATPAFSGASRQIRDTASHALRVAGLWYRRHRDRRLLTLMDERLLKDIGLTHDMVIRESMKRFWER
jgi:uncharacterized protein YjiS (DUF1127 family)